MKTKSTTIGVILVKHNKKFTKKKKKKYPKEVFKTKLNNIKFSNKLHTQLFLDYNCKVRYKLDGYTVVP